MKEALKQVKEKKCIRCDSNLKGKEFYEYDTHRKIQRMDGGSYESDNYNLICSTCHMKEHGTYRERSESLHKLKMMFDGYKQIQKLKNKVNNQIRAMQRNTDELDEIDLAYIEEVLKSVTEKEKQKDKLIKEWVKNNQDLKIVGAMQSVKGVGHITIAACLSYLEIDKAKHASSFWSYAGYWCASHERKSKKLETPILYIDDKGKEKKRWYNPGCQVLRNALYVTAGVFIKQGGPYREVYDRRKHKTENSEKITNTRITGKAGVFKKAWKDVSKGHRHGDAIRVMMKHFLADLWFAWRTIEGLPVNDLYVKEHLGHKSAIINPILRGWEY
jgi:cytochrome c553